MQWTRHRILIWGKTRPELSKSYREIVCTGGILEDTRRLVRLYPVPLRYLDDQKVFKKYQWIEADIARNPSDARPESHKIRFESIEIRETIPTRNGDWSERARWVMQPENIFQSVESLQERQQLDKTSLGLVQPARIVDVTDHVVPANEKATAAERYREAISQMELPLDPETGREIRPLRAAEYRFRIHFRCDDDRCLKNHSFSILDWEMDALYFRLRSQEERPPNLAAKGVVEKLREICGATKDTYFFLGNIASHPTNFTIVGLWYPKRQPQRTLFG